MIFEYNKLTQASNRPMTSQERLSLLFFVGKFFLSKFGIFLLFLSLNILPSIFNQKLVQTLPTQLSEAQLGPCTSEVGLSKARPQGTCLRCSPYMDLRSWSDIQAKLDFQKIKNYCIIATIVTLFLNPQQTKYFGGLSVVLKQAGFFSKYSKSEQIVYIFSWVFIVVFFRSSFQIASYLK